MIHIHPAIIITSIIAVVIIYAVFNVTLAARNASSYSGYWKHKASEPIENNSFHLVTLGDSAMEAIGASKPEDGIAGRAAAYIHKKTGRPVHITNKSIGGATIQNVLRHQIDQDEIAGADLILIASSNDMQQQKNKQLYREDLEALFRVLPAEKVIISDLPLMPGRDPYQAVLRDVADAHMVARADFASVFNGDGRRLDIFSWLPPHLNSKGYYYWYKSYEPQIDRLLDGKD